MTRCLEKNNDQLIYIQMTSSSYLIISMLLSRETIQTYSFVCRHNRIVRVNIRQQLHFLNVIEQDLTEPEFIHNCQNSKLSYYCLFMSETCFCFTAKFLLCFLTYDCDMIIDYIF